MKIVKTAALSLIAAASLVVTLSPAAAGPHRHQVCHMERHHGHSTRVCHWVG